VHSDGFAYGDALPDYFLLVCSAHSEARLLLLLLPPPSLLSCLLRP
jgi:hypothetical protein